MISDAGFFPKENRSTTSPCQNAPPQEQESGKQSTEVAAQAPLPPDEHKAVRWEGGDRRKNTKSKAAAGTEKKDDVGRMWVSPMKRKSMLFIPCNKLF